MKVLTTVKEVLLLKDDFEIEGTDVPEHHVTYALNEWDEYALEAAVQLAEDGIADEVVTVTIGPDRAEETIRQALAKGADRAIRVWDDPLDDADVLDVGAKTKLFRAVVEEEDPDLVFTGVQTGDDSFGATGVSLAAAVDFQWAAVVNDLEVDPDANIAQISRELEGGTEERTEIELPAVLTIQTGINEPRYASLRGIRQAQRKELDHRTLATLGVDADAVAGDLRLRDAYEPESEGDVAVFKGGAEETAGELADLLREKGVAP